MFEKETANNPDSFIDSAHNWSLIHFGLNFANRAFFEV